MFVYKVEKSKDEIKTNVVSLFILLIYCMTGWLFKIVQKVLLPEKYYDWSL